MNLGVLSDIHANATALDVVLADGRARGVDAWWALGDLVAIGPDPEAVLERIAELPNAVVTRGNTDRYVTTGDRPPPYEADVRADPSLRALFDEVQASFDWTARRVSDAGWLAWLAALPLETRSTLDDGTQSLGVHASPGRDDGDGITPDRPEDALAGALVGAEADVVLAGHTHRPTDRVVGHVRAVNAGSVGNPITEDLRASYVIVRSGGRAGHTVEHHRVAYDRDAFLHRVVRSRHPARDYIASFQRDRSRGTAAG